MVRCTKLYYLLQQGMVRCTKLHYPLQLGMVRCTKLYYSLRLGMVRCTKLYYPLQQGMVRCTKLCYSLQQCVGLTSSGAATTPRACPFQQSVTGTWTVGTEQMNLTAPVVRSLE